MNWWTLLRRFPGWFMSAGIIVAACLTLVLWLAFRSKPSEQQAAGGIQAVQSEQMQDFKFADVVLCGNNVINFKTGEVVVRDWIEGAGDSLPADIRPLPDKENILVSNRGISVAIGKNGKAKPALTDAGKPIPSLAMNSSGDEVVFPSKGDLWKGKVNWEKSSLTDVGKVTDTGYFRDDVFKGAWFWTGDDLYVSVAGRPHLISVGSGEVKADQPPADRIAKGASPDGKLVAIATSSGEFAVAEFATGSLKRFPTVGQVTDVRWLTDDRVAVLCSSKQLTIYDHAKGRVTLDIRLGQQAHAIGSVARGGDYLLLGTRTEMKFLNVKSGKEVPLMLPVTEGAWATSEALLGSCSDTDSAPRGIWLLGVDGSREKVLGQPMDSGRGSSTAVEIERGVLFVSGGDLWEYQAATKQVRQITHGERLQPDIRLLAAQ